MAYIIMARAALAQQQDAQAVSWGYYKTAAGPLKVFWIDAGIYQAIYEGAPLDCDYMNAEIDQMPFILAGTSFQIAVWKALIAIPRGKRVSYSDVAQCIGRPTAHRAVANAIGDNAIAYFIPCHRVVRVNGELSGYRWGVSYKAALLASEETRF